MIAGIDLGTTHTSITWRNNPKNYFQKNSFTTHLIPSCVFYTSGNEVVVGELARSQAVLGKKGAFYSVKRILGDENHLEERTPFEICCLIIKECLRIAEKNSGQKVTGVVISVPALFNEKQRRIVKNSAVQAGIEVLDLVPEPVAGAIGSWNKCPSMVVADLGGGTFDICLVKMTENKFEVVSLGGNSKLGGDDFTTVISDHIIEKWEIENDAMPYVKTRLWFLAESIKCELSFKSEVLVDFQYENREGKICEIKDTITQNEIKHLLSPLLKKIEKVSVDFLQSISGQSPDEILLSGGGIKMPSVEESLKNSFPHLKCRVSQKNDLVSTGALILGESIDGINNNFLMNDYVKVNIGVKTDGGDLCLFLTAGTSLPTEKTIQFIPCKESAGRVRIEIFEGISDWADENLLRGNIEIPIVELLSGKKSAFSITVGIDVKGNLYGYVSTLDHNKRFDIQIDNDFSNNAFQLACHLSRVSNTKVLDDWEQDSNFYDRSEELLQRGEKIASMLWKKHRKDSIALKELLKKLKHYIKIRNRPMISGVALVVTERISEIIQREI